MTQKTTLPGSFTGPLVDSLPKFIHSAPVSSGLVRRYAASTLNSTQVGQALASLPDLTGKGAPLAQADAALQPTVKQVGPIRYLEFAGDAMRGDASGGKTFAVVGRFRGTPTGGYYPIASLGTFGGGALSRTQNGTMSSYGTASLNGNANPGADWQVFIASFTGTDSVIRVGTSEVVGNAGTTTAVQTNLGLDTSDKPVSLIDVAELLIWDRSLTLAERGKVVADLRAAYGI